MADASLVSLAEAGEHVWLEVQLVERPSDTLFGVNVIVDSDGSQSTGLPWWGEGSTFTFDRLASAWIARDATGAWRGAVGLTDAASSFEGEMTMLGDGSVGFAFDAKARAVYLRLERAALGGPDATFVVAVGSNAQWNDDLPDEGGFRFE